MKQGLETYTKGEIEPSSRGDVHIRKLTVFFFGLNVVLVIVTVVLLSLTPPVPEVGQCAKWGENSTVGLSSLIQQITQEEIQKPQTHYLGWGKNLDPDAVFNNTDSPEKSEQAHLSNLYPCAPHRPSAFDVLCWNKSCEQSFCNSPLTYDNGRVRVNTAGYYFIYSRLQFDVSSLSEQWLSLTHEMLKKSGNSQRPPQRLVENRHVMTRPEKDIVPSYLGAVFYLYGSDYIYVRVNRLSAKYLVPDASYFGVFKV